MEQEKAFELANGQAILSSLVRRGIRGKLLKWTQDFPHQRYARARFQGKTSTPQHLENGTPQESILSTFLFNVLVENLVTLLLQHETKILCYADDVAIVVTGSHYQQKKHRTQLQQLKTNSMNLGLKINLHKSKAIYSRSLSPPPPLSVQKHAIDWAISYIYFGIWIDQKVTFKKHIATIKEKAAVRMRAPLKEPLSESSELSIYR